MPRFLKVFIASPGDVARERKAAERAISAVSKRLVSLYDVALQPVGWENFAPLASTSQDIAVQVGINRRVQECRIFIGILYRRYGTPVESLDGRSGTESEFTTALNQRKTTKILTYLRDPQVGEPLRMTTEAVEQLAKLNELKTRLQKEHILSRDYKAVRTLESRLVLDLFEAALDIITDADRRKALAKFFQFAAAPKSIEPSVLIAYPAIHKHQHSSASPKNEYDWQQRLLPNVVYEDFKAIQKLESAAQLVGVATSAVTIDSPKLATPGNRIWLCLPRNPNAAQELKRFQSSCRFRFINEAESDKRAIVWTRADGETVTIRSPLATYLQARPIHRVPWDPRYGNDRAVDFAIIARFGPSAASDCREKFWHYFIAGLRGLGTWGAAWFIERRAAELGRLVDQSGGDSTQAILQVTYQDFHIDEVRDVSGETQAYFDEASARAHEYIAKRRSRTTVHRA